MGCEKITISSWSDPFFPSSLEPIYSAMICGKNNPQNDACCLLWRGVYFCFHHNTFSASIDTSVVHCTPPFLLTKKLLCIQSFSCVWKCFQMPHFSHFFFFGKKNHTKKRKLIATLNANKMILQCMYISWRYTCVSNFVCIYLITITRIRTKSISIHLEIRAKVNFMEDLQRAIHKRAVKY